MAAQKGFAGKFSFINLVMPLLETASKYVGPALSELNGDVSVLSKAKQIFTGCTLILYQKHLIRCCSSLKWQKATVTRHPIEFHSGRTSRLSLPYWSGFCCFTSQILHRRCSWWQIWRYWTGFRSCPACDGFSLDLKKTGTSFPKNRLYKTFKLYSTDNGQLICQHWNGLKFTWTGKHCCIWFALQ